jgi:hypothetical protein
MHLSFTSMTSAVLAIASPSPACLTSQLGKNTKGGDLLHFAQDDEDPQKCRAACCDNPSCGKWTLNFRNSTYVAPPCVNGTACCVLRLKTNFTDGFADSNAVACGVKPPAPLPEPPLAPFIMWMSERTGSSWTTSLLSQHPNIVAFGEEYNSADVGTLQSALHGTTPRMAQAISSKPNATRFGFKIKFFPSCHLGTCQQSERSSVLASHNVSVICLLRHNSFERAVSHYFLEEMVKRGCHPNVNAASGQKCIPITLTVDPDRLYNSTVQRARMTERQRTACEMRAATTPTFFLWYESLMNDVSREWARLQSFLGVPAVALPKGGPVKIVSRPLDESILNWRDVLGRFSGTPFAHFIVESNEVSTKIDDEDDDQEANMDMRV